MKKLLIIFISCFILLTPQISFAKVSQERIQKELVVARFEVKKQYGEDFNKKLDKFFIDQIMNNDQKKLNNFISILQPYFQKRWNSKNLSKKETLYKYLLIRSYYEIYYRK